MTQVERLMLSVSPAIVNATYIAPKISAALSIVGSSLIVYDVIRRYVCPRRNERIATRHRLLLGMCLCDLCSSTAQFVWSWAVPPDDPPSPFARAQYGTWGTCQAQGFFTQIFVGTMAYNSTLAFYYFLVIYKGISESVIATRYEPYLHVIPIVLALVTSSASVALGLINPVITQCWIAAYPLQCQQSWKADGRYPICQRGEHAETYRLAFFTFPLLVSLLFVTIIMLVIYRKMRHVEKSSGRYHPGHHLGDSARVTRRSTQSSRFAVQAFLYVGAFYVTWIFAMLTTLISVISNSYTPLNAILNLLSVSLMPLQGFWNAIVYFYPQWRRSRRTSIRSSQDIEQRHQRTSAGPSSRDSLSLHVQSSEIMHGVTSNKDDNFPVPIKEELKLTAKSNGVAEVCDSDQGTDC